MNLDYILFGALIMRGINFVLWALVILRVFRHDRPVSRLSRQLISLVVFGGMGILLIGGFVPFGFPVALARIINNAWTAAALLVALGIISVKDDESP